MKTSDEINKLIQQESRAHLSREIRGSDKLCLAIWSAALEDVKTTALKQGGFVTMTDLDAMLARAAEALGAITGVRGGPRR